MNNIVPLVIYKGGERFIVGNAVIDDNKLTDVRIYGEFFKMAEGSYSIGPNAGRSELPPFPDPEAEVIHAFSDFKNLLTKLLPNGKSLRMVVALLEHVQLWAMKGVRGY